MERIVIIDHETHQLYIEDVDEDVLQEQYGGEEEAYIKDKYNLEGDFSWDYIVNAQYRHNDYSDPIEIDFEGLVKN